MTKRINTPDSRMPWCIVTDSHGTSAEHCLTCYATRREAMEAMEQAAEDGQNADLMRTRTAIRSYPDYIIQ